MIVSIEPHTSNLSAPMLTKFFFVDLFPLYVNRRSVGLPKPALSHGDRKQFDENIQATLSYSSCDDPYF